MSGSTLAILIFAGYVFMGMVAARFVYVTAVDRDWWDTRGREDVARAAGGFIGMTWPILIIFGLYKVLGWILFRPTRRQRRAAAIRRAKELEEERRRRFAEAEAIVLGKTEPHRLASESLPLGNRPEAPPLRWE